MKKKLILQSSRGISDCQSMKLMLVYFFGLLVMFYRSKHKTMHLSR